MHDLIGRVFERLTVIEPVRIRRESGRSVLKWKCRCSCGEERLVVTDDLLNGRHKSCGCLRKEKASKHGMSRYKEYRAYTDMISRCYNESNINFSYYGAKGIKVCDRWLESFENFYEDMGKRPEDLSLERKDHTGDYTPENCEWADWFRQMANRGIQSNNSSGRTGVYLTDGGKWTAQIKFKNETIHLGNFVSFEKACKIREEAELKYFGFIKEFDSDGSNICNTEEMVWYQNLNNCKEEIKMFEFNVENVNSNNTGNNSNRPQVDWDARAKYIVDAVGTQKKAKAMIGIISGIIDLGLQAQEDAKMEFKGDAAEEAAELEKNPEQYFETLPNDKGVPTRYKRWKVKPCQQVAFTVDFPSVMINQGQFFGDENAKEHPLRMLLNGEFYIKEVGKVVGKPYNIKEVRNDDGSWSFKSNTQIYKMASAVDVLDDQGRFKPHMIGKLLGKAALFEVQVFLQESGGKQYLNEKIKLSGQVPDVMVPMIPELPEEYIYGVNFKGVQDPKVLKQLRQSVINTMRLAQNFEGSDIQKALDALKSGEVKQEQEAPKQEAKAAPEPAPDFDDSDIPFMNPYFGVRGLLV